MICRVIEKHLCYPLFADCLLITPPTVEYFNTKAKKLPATELEQGKLTEIREALTNCSRKYAIFDRFCLLIDTLDSVRFFIVFFMLLV